MSDIVTVGWAGAAGLVPLARPVFEAISVCAHIPVVRAASVMPVKIRFRLAFMEVQSSPFEFTFVPFLQGGDNRGSSPRDVAAWTLLFPGRQYWILPAQLMHLLQSTY